MFASYVKRWVVSGVIFLFIGFVINIIDGAPPFVNIIITIVLAVAIIVMIMLNKDKFSWR
jgi:hypothetical protein